MKKILLLPIILLPVIGISAQTWPDDSERILTLFGRPASGHFGRGLEFEAVGQRVIAWNDGEVIWSDVSSVSSPVPSETLIVVEHEGGFRSYYRRVESRPDLERTISQGDWIGYADDETWLFQVTDSMRSRIVDPISLLPSWDGDGNSSDLKAFLTRGNESWALQDGLVLTPGIWSLVLEGVIPVEVSLYWVGRSVISMRFESLVEQDGVTVMETPEPVAYDRIYNEDGWMTLRDIRLNAGLGILELRTQHEKDLVYSQFWNLMIQAK